MRGPIPVTLAAGGRELAGLVARLAHPSSGAAIVGPERIVGTTTASVAVAVEPDVGARSAGCPCCQVRLDLVDGVARAVGRRTPPHRVVVALDPDDDVVTAVHTILSDPTLARIVRLDAVLATVDAVQWATRLNVGGPFDTAIGLDRLAVADRIVVARSGDVTSDALVAIGHVLRSINPVGSVITPTPAQVPLELLVDLHAWHGAPAVDRGPRSPAPFLGPDVPVTVVCRTDRPLDTDRIDEWLDEVVTRHAPRLLRLQGAIAVPGQQERTCIHGVRSWSMVHSEAELPAGRRSTSSAVLLVGRQLPIAELRAEFAAAHR